MTTKNFVVKNGLTTGNIILDASSSNITANVVVANLSVPSSANLGAVGNVKITGGSADYVLATDGTGNLRWTAQTGGSGGNVSTATVRVTADSFTANGGGNTYTLSVTPPGSASVMVNIDGVFQLHSAYGISGNLLTLNGTPTTGAIVEVTSFTSDILAGSNTEVLFNDAGNTNASSNFTFNKSTNTLNATNITANGTPVATTGKAIAMAIVFGG